jgi:hypothetical protein
MRFLKFLMPVIVAALLLISSGVYSVRVVTAAQKERTAHAKKPLRFHYVCPMHEDVTSTKRGACPKCKMKLVKKPIPDEPTTSSN